jgi:hypothetical protein
MAGRLWSAFYFFDTAREPLPNSSSSESEAHRADPFYIVYYLQYNLLPIRPDWINLVFCKALSGTPSGLKSRLPPWNSDGSVAH